MEEQKITVEQRMQNRVLNAVWHYRWGEKNQQDDIKLIQAIYLLVGAGCFDEAAALANTQPVVAEIWKLALN